MKAETIAPEIRALVREVAPGAQARRVQGMVVWQGARVLLVGVAVGLAVAAASTRALRSLLFGVGALDPVTFAAVAGGMVLGAAGGLPAGAARVAGGSDRVTQGRVALPAVVSARASACLAADTHPVSVGFTRPRVSRSDRM